MTQNSEQPHIKLKLNICHEPRNHDKDVSEVEDYVEQMLNHPSEQVTDVRIAVGRAAGAIFLHLLPKRWSSESIESLKNGATMWLEKENYAEDIFIRSTKWEAVLEE